MGYSTLPRPHRLLPKLPRVQLVQKKHFSPPDFLYFIQIFQNQIKKRPPRKHKPTWFPQDSVDQLPFFAKDHRLDPSPTLPPLLKNIFSFSLSLFPVATFPLSPLLIFKKSRGQKEFEWEEEDEKKEGKRRKKKNTKRLVLRSIS